MQIQIFKLQVPKLSINDIKSVKSNKTLFRVCQTNPHCVGIKYVHIKLLCKKTQIKTLHTVLRRY